MFGLKRRNETGCSTRLSAGNRPLKSAKLSSESRCTGAQSAKPAVSPGRARCAMGDLPRKDSLKWRPCSPEANRTMRKRSSVFILLCRRMKRVIQSAASCPAQYPLSARPNHKFLYRSDTITLSPSVYALSSTGRASSPSSGLPSTLSTRRPAAPAAPGAVMATCRRASFGWMRWSCTRPSSPQTHHCRSTGTNGPSANARPCGATRAQASDTPRQDFMG
mmetsp:Transcript_43889/g.88463  ORF Transcript_43889/g.88463 Transcript_43889/m.88463 type:complete len:220 (+) Transcript_43889:445-1104(+)